MTYFSNFANYCMENKGKVFIFLVIFHAINVILFDLIQQSNYLVGLHDAKPGCWDFAMDCFLYQSEAIDLLEFLKNSQWLEWFFLYSHHLHVKIISLVYWITGISSPVVYEVTILPIIWASSILLIYKATHLLFPYSNKIPLITILFFFQPSFFLHSTQLLRDPYFSLGFCFLIYGIIVFYKNKSSWDGVLNINFGILLMIAMRSYLSPLLFACLAIFAIIFIYQKRASYLHLIILILPLLIFQNFSVNKYLSIDKFKNKLNTEFAQMPDLDRFEEIILIEENKIDKKFEIFLEQQVKVFELSLIDSCLNKLSNPDTIQEGPSTDLFDQELGSIEFQNSSDEQKKSIFEQKKTNLIDVEIDHVVEEPHLDKQIIAIEKDLQKKYYANKGLDEVGIDCNLSFEEQKTNLIKTFRQIYDEKKSADRAINFEYLEVFDAEKFEEKKRKLDQGFFARIKTNPESSPYLVSILNIFDNVATQVSGLRLGFHNYGRNIQGGSYVNVNQDYVNFDALISYLPKAMYYGLLSPFPTIFYKSGDETGRIGNILAGIETLIFYILLIGFFYMLFKDPIQIAPISIVIIFSIVVIVLLGYVVPNLGALYRLRQPYLIPFFIVGVQGLYLIFKHSNNKLKQT
jgi:hypothetical protein